MRPLGIARVCALGLVTVGVLAFPSSSFGEARSGVAALQVALHARGLYAAPIDGLLGPLTREALSGYQADNGLYTTATIDEPTLQSLGLG